MSEPPAVSVIIPARNEQALLGRALESVLQQETNRRFDIVVIDNGSTDGTAKQARDLIAKTDMPMMLVSEARPGIAVAKNAGARAASGHTLLFMDADSYMSPNLVDEVCQAAGRGCAVGSIRVLAEPGSASIDRAVFSLTEFGKRYLGVRAQMLFTDRRLFESLGGFDEGVRLGEDVEYLRRVARQLRSERLAGPIHLTSGQIMTSPRRLARHHHLGVAQMFGRWMLAYVGVGRNRPY
jgi:glycosyltransferase involved in cell wall biosynthesis